MGSAVGGFFSRIILCSAVASAGILLLPGSAAPASKSDPSEKPPGAVEVAQVASTNEVTTSSECSSSAAPACVPGHTCECLAFQATMTRARPVLRRARRGEGRINEQILIDLSDGAENGAGGSCFPWNGVGLLSIKKSTIAMPQHGRVCEVGSSMDELSGEGVFDLEGGTEQLADAIGQGTISFTFRPATNRAIAASGESATTVIVHTELSVVCSSCGGLWK